MKKILLLSFYFHPCTLTPAQRITYWARNLYQLGYFPIVITREWKGELRTHADTKLPLGKEVRHEKFDHYEVYYLPFRPGILDRAYRNWGENRLRPLFLGTKFLDVLLTGLSLRFSSFRNILPFIRELQKKEAIGQLIVSGEPFYLFKIGYLARKNLNIPWIADYRDDWSTNELQRQKSGGSLRELIFKIEARYEKKWVGTAKGIISVSDNYSARIATFLDLPGITIANGFEETLWDLPDHSLFEEFTVVYSGTLYPSQNVEIILEALSIACQQQKPFKLVFLGTGFDIKETRRIERLIDPGIKPYVKITERMPRAQALVCLKKAHALLGIAYGNLKGIPTSKLYEYVGLLKPVILCPTDRDVMERILTDVGLGFFASDPSSCLAQVEAIRQLYKSNSIADRRAAAKEKAGRFGRYEQLKKIKPMLDG